MKITKLPLRNSLKDKYKVVFYLICSVVLLILYFIVNKPDVGVGLFVGGIIGLACAWKVTMVSSLTLSNTYTNRNIIHDGLEKYGYNEIRQNFFRVKSSKLLRFESQDVYLKFHGTCFDIEGPYYILKLLVAKLKKSCAD